MVGGVELGGRGGFVGEGRGWGVGEVLGGELGFRDSFRASKRYLSKAPSPPYTALQSPYLFPLPPPPLSPPFPKPPTQKQRQRNQRLTIRPVYILPRLFPANHILHLLALHLPPLVVPLVDQELVRARAALEPVLPFGEGHGRGGARHGERVGAGGTDWEGGVSFGGEGGERRGDGRRGGEGGGRTYRGACWWW